MPRCSCAEQGLAWTSVPGLPQGFAFLTAATSHKIHKIHAGIPVHPGTSDSGKTPVRQRAAPLAAALRQQRCRSFAGLSCEEAAASGHGKRRLPGCSRPGRVVPRFRGSGGAVLSLHGAKEPPPPLACALAPMRAGPRYPKVCRLIRIASPWALVLSNM